MKERKQENLVAGIVGAFLGSPLGAVCIILVGQLGYVASICGLAMLHFFTLLGAVPMILSRISCQQRS